ncbi:MAG: energy transducer TonB [Saprospiraceae bacterium]|nr:energy transducer TonB [Saprospiraceae bacterium]
MDPQKVLQVPLDDIVFEGRNQAYGAYFLRKIYNRHLFRALVVAGLLSLLAIAIPLLVSYINGLINSGKDEEVSVEINMENLDLPPEKEDTPPPPPPEEPPPMKATIRYIVPDPKKDEEVVDEEPPPPVEQLATADISNKTQEGNEEGASEGEIDVPEEAPPPVVEEEKPSAEIFVVVEQKPEFDGGEAGLLRYVAENVKYPAIARENSIEGKVVVKFVVDEQGNVSQANVVRGIGGGCDQEALRVVGTMSGKWKPGKQRGRPVKVWFTLPISFKLQ